MPQQAETCQDPRNAPLNSLQGGAESVQLVAASHLFLSFKLLGALKGWTQTMTGECLAAFWLLCPSKDLCSLPGGPRKCTAYPMLPPHRFRSVAPLLCLQRGPGQSGVCSKPLCARCLVTVMLAQQQCKPATACREALDSGEYAAAFWLCAQCCKSMEDLQRLKVSQQLNHTINKLYEDTLSRLEGALQVACADFQAETYQKARWHSNRTELALKSCPAIWHRHLK